MSVLPDHEIERLSKRAIGPKLIEPYTSRLLQPASYDVRLAKELLVPVKDVPGRWIGTLSDLREPLAQGEMREQDPAESYTIYPGQFVLGSTMEWVNIPDDLVGRIEGKSTIARRGVQIHSAGYLDPGFRGNVTLELVNFWPTAVVIWVGDSIGQLSFSPLTSRARRSYGSPGVGSHYQDSEGTIEGRSGEPGT